MLILLEYNGIKLKFTQEELVNLGLNIASDNYNQQNILTWIQAHKLNPLSR